MSRITDHAYDAGPVNTGAPCIAWATGEPMGAGTLVLRPTNVCGKLEHEHRYSEYVEGNPGDMHEPKPYTGELDWSDGTYFDH